MLVLFEIFQKVNRTRPNNKCSVHLTMGCEDLKAYHTKIVEDRIQVLGEVIGV